LTPPLIFDLDGTLVDSHVVVERQWRLVCERLGIDFGKLVTVLHGVRSIDTLRAYAPEADVEAEAEALAAAEEADTDGLRAVAGAHEVLAALPAGGWGIFTSGHRSLAESRLRGLGLPVPAIMVCAEDVTKGKPDPEGYLTAARRLGAAPGACVVVEDAPAGIQAGLAAGMRVIGITTTHPAGALTGVSAVIDDLHGLDAALATLRR
jgi:sugar-phosphatase